MKKFILIISIFIFCIFIGCAIPIKKERDKQDKEYQDWEIKAKDAKGYSPSQGVELDLPADVIEDINKQISEIREDNSLTVSEKSAKLNELPTERVTLDMQNVDISIFLRALAKAANQNIIINDNVKGNVKLNIKDAPWNEVFLSVIDSYGLTYEWNGDIIRIITLSDLQHGVELMKANREKKEYEIEMRSLGKKSILLEPMVTWVYQVKYADAVSIKENIEGFFSQRRIKSDDKIQEDTIKPAFHGAIVVDPYTNSLIVHTLQSDLAKFKTIIARIDRPSKQILIEAHIVEATNETAKELGIQWGGLYNNTSNGNFWIGSNAESAREVAQDSSVSPLSDFAVSFPAESVKGDLPATIGYIAQDIGKSILAFQLSALQREGKINILSHPSITTLDNQTATIESGKDIPFQTIEDGEINIVFKKAVIKLDVTPHIIDENTVKMKIIAQKDELDETVSVAGNPAIMTKNAETSVVLFNGQTTVIGGLNKDKKIKSNSGVPGVKDIPVLGYLFKGQHNSSEMDQLMIFITPYILEEKKVSVKKIK